MFAVVVIRHLVDAVHMPVNTKKVLRFLFVARPDRYICYGEQSHAVLKKLKEDGKKMFLITNSPLDFV